MRFPAFTFTEALVIEAVVLTFAFYLLFQLSSHRSASKGSLVVSRLTSLFALVFSKGYVILVTSFLLVTVYSMFQGYRPNAYFFLLSIFTLYMVFENAYQTSGRRKVLIICLVSLLIPITVAVNNNLMPFWGDSRSILNRGYDILETGTLKDYGGSSYYYPFPVLALLLASITAATGFSLNAYALLVPVCSLLVVSTLYLISREMSGSKRMASLTPLLIFSIPSLNFISLLPMYLSIIFAFVCLFLVVKLIHTKCRRFILCLIPLLIVTVVSHPSGPVLILSLIAPLGIYSMIRRNSSTVPRQFKFVPLLTLLIMLFYWIFAHEILVTVMGPVRDLSTTIIDYISGSELSAKITERPYLQEAAGLTNVAFAWAVPPAVAAGYLLHRHRGVSSSHDVKEDGNWLDKMLVSGSGAGLVLLLVSFLGAQYGEYTYLILPTYAVFAFLMILLLPKLLSSKNKVVVITTVVILAASLFVGSSSPNWAPIENPDFPQKKTLFKQYISTSRFAEYLPRNTSLTAVLDFDVTLEVPQDVEIVFISSSYRVVRRELSSLENGVPINELADGNFMIFVVRLERLRLHGDDIFNLVRTNGRHVMITVTSSS
jgi:hypothetical protein